MQNAANQGFKKPGVNSDPNERIPKELERTYQLVIVPGEFGKKKITKMRDIRAL